MKTHLFDSSAVLVPSHTVTRLLAFTKQSCSRFGKCPSFYKLKVSFEHPSQTSILSKRSACLYQMPAALGGVGAQAVYRQHFSYAIYQTSSSMYAAMRAPPVCPKTSEILSPGWLGKLPVRRIYLHACWITKTVCWGQSKRFGESLF
jgi:hypothetical protein